MPRLQHFYTGDEDQLPPPPPLNLEEDSDSWWAGVRHSFVAIALATGLAVAAASTAQAQQLQWHEQNEIVEQPPPFAPDEDYWLTLSDYREKYTSWLPPVDEEVVSAEGVSRVKRWLSVVLTKAGKRGM